MQFCGHDMAFFFGSLSHGMKLSSFVRLNALGVSYFASYLMVVQLETTLTNMFTYLIS